MGELPFHKCERLAHKLMEIRRRALSGAGTSNCEQIVDSESEPVDLGDENAAGFLCRRIRWTRALQQHLRGHAQTRQRIANLMRHASRDLARYREALGLEQFRL